MSWPMAGYARNVEDHLNKSSSEWKFQVTDPAAHATSAGMRIESRNNKTDEILKVIVQPYSACCAFDQLNYFSYRSMDEKKIHEILNQIFVALRHHYSGSFGRKLVLNTVQRNEEAYSPSDLKLLGKKMTGMYYYSFIHSWATSQKAGFLDQPIVNHNTSNIIHHLITMPDVCQADYKIDFDDEDEEE